MTDFHKDTKKIMVFTLIIAVIMIGFYYNYYNMVDNYLYDCYQRIEYLFNIEHESDVTVIEINDLTYNKLDDKPISRDKFVQAIDKLNEDGAKMIIFDILFDQPQETQADSMMLDRLGSNNNIIMPVEVQYSKSTSDSNEYIIENIKEPLPSFNNLVKTGHNTIISESNNIVRNLPPLFIQGNSSYLPIGRRAAEAALGEEIVITEGEYLINYLGPENTINSISFHDYLNNNYYKEDINNKLVLIGVNEEGITKNYNSIFSSEGEYTRLHLLALLTNNYFNQNFIRVNEVGTNILVVFIILYLAVFLFERYRPSKSLLLLLLINLFIVSLNFYLTIEHFLFTKISVYLIGTTILYIISLITWYFLNRKKKFEIAKKLSPYFSDYIINKIKEEPEKLNTKGEKTAATVMLLEFTNFNSYFNETTSEKVIEDLNHYYRNISNIIFKYDGAISNYLGDGVIAYWSNSFDQSNHRNRAVKTAVEIMKFFENQNIELKPTITIDSGKVILGDIGSKDRMDFKAMGESIHITTELAEISDSYQILIGENTYYGLSEIYKKLDWKYKEVNIEGIEKTLVVYSLKKFKDLTKCQT
ncbi:MAG: CHASE2 domain-containing protein [Bacillota bacterium]